MQAFSHAIPKALIRCVYQSILLLLFQIRNELKSCLTVHNAFNAQKANRTATVDVKDCLDRKDSPMNAAYQVGKESMLPKKRVALHENIFV
jgi:hypothetical protein